MGSFIMMLVLTSSGVHYAALQRIKAGDKRTWQIGGLAALVLGLTAVVLQILELLFLPFWPGSSGFASVFVGFYSVFTVVLLAGLLWLEMLLARSRSILAIFFVEQPPTYAEAFAVQRFQANLSAFNLTWAFLAVMAVLFWFLFYVI
jgi:heme/copper-type cytochrome/quinol oxidase subunit 3